jgi:hypothetical protein
MKHRDGNGNLIYERRTCRDGEASSWATLDDVPDHIRTNPRKYFGKLVVKDQYAVVDPSVRGTYLSFETTEEQREENIREQRKKSFEALVKAMGSGQSQLNAYVIRFSNSCSEDVEDADGVITSRGDIFVDLIAESGVTMESEQATESESNTEAPSVEKLTLLSLYDDVQVKSTVRSNFTNHVMDQMQRGGSTLKLFHRNNNDENTIHSVFSVAELGNITVDSFLASIPRNNEGPIPGAAFPIHLSISIEEDSAISGNFI